MSHALLRMPEFQTSMRPSAPVEPPAAVAALAFTVPLCTDTMTKGGGGGTGVGHSASCLLLPCPLLLPLDLSSVKHRLFLHCGLAAMRPCQHSVLDGASCKAPGTPLAHW
jgi:hypothetical protein